MKKLKIEIKYAVISSCAIVIWMILEKITGFHDSNIHIQPIVTNFYGVVGIILYYLALKEKKVKYYGGDMTWAQGFLSGIYLSTFLAVLSPLYNSIIFNVISHDFFENMVKQFDQQEESKIVEATRSFYNLKSIIFQSCLDSLSFGILTAAILSLFLGKKSTS
jgi:hypothetical protein